jgi:hypothetical protein
MQLRLPVVAISRLGFADTILCHSRARPRANLRFRTIYSWRLSARGEWSIFDKRYWPGEKFGDHLSIALRHQQIDLLILKRVFEAAPKDATETLVRAAPTGIPVSRMWYLEVDNAPERHCH